MASTRGHAEQALAMYNLLLLLEINEIPSVPAGVPVSVFTAPHVKEIVHGIFIKEFSTENIEFLMKLFDVCEAYGYGSLSSEKMIALDASLRGIAEKYILSGIVNLPFAQFEIIKKKCKDAEPLLILDDFSEAADIIRLLVLNDTLRRTFAANKVSYGEAYSKDRPAIVIANLGHYAAICAGCGVQKDRPLLHVASPLEKSLTIVLKIKEALEKNQAKKLRGKMTEKEFDNQFRKLCQSAVDELKDVMMKVEVSESKRVGATKIAVPALLDSTHALEAHGLGIKRQEKVDLSEEKQERKSPELTLRPDAAARKKPVGSRPLTLFETPSTPQGRSIRDVFEEGAPGADPKKKRRPSV